MNQGERLKKFLAKHRVFQTELAEKLNINKSNINRQLKNETVSPKLLRAVSDITGMSVPEIEDELENMAVSTPVVPLQEYSELQSKYIMVQESRLEYEKRTNKEMAELHKKYEESLKIIAELKGEKKG